MGAIAPLFLSQSPMALAAPRMITLGVYPLNTGDVNITYFPQCPNEITITETPRPYQEGSYTTDGMAYLVG